MKRSAHLLLLSLVTLVFFTAKTQGALPVKDPIVIEVVTKYTGTEEALTATKNILLGKKFITANGIQKTTFTATRTTGAKADYYVADVTASDEGGKVKITISFVKVGTGLLNLKKIAQQVEEELK